VLLTLRKAEEREQLRREVGRLREEVMSEVKFGEIVARSPLMTSALDVATKVARHDSPVLVTGQTGTGKELIARLIHRESPRRDALFVAVNCGAIPENLVESILFGHEKGAFTGAVDKRIGKFQEADGGTLFLDEVGELPLDAQVKLLRALQEGEIDPVGSKKSVKVNFRLISATNRDMIQLVKEGKFREDLYYRLNVFPVVVPPLRERMGDVPELARYFLARFAAEEGKRITAISSDAMSMLASYAWPGNVRQLENAVFRAVVLADKAELTVDEFPQIAAHVEGFQAEMPEAPEWVDPHPAYTGPALLGAEDSIPRTIEVSREPGRNALGIPAMDDSGEIRSLEAMEADMIRLALGRYRGHMTEVAKRLNIGRSTLYRKMRDYGLEGRLS
jgi:DNA-binding NtrC family response regulator